MLESVEVVLTDGEVPAAGCEAVLIGVDVPIDGELELNGWEVSKIDCDVEMIGDKVVLINGDV